MDVTLTRLERHLQRHRELFVKAVTDLTGFGKGHDPAGGVIIVDLIVADYVVCRDPRVQGQIDDCVLFREGGCGGCCGWLPIPRVGARVTARVRARIRGLGVRARVRMQGGKHTVRFRGVGSGVGQG